MPDINALHRSHPHNGAVDTLIIHLYQGHFWLSLLTVVFLVGIVLMPLRGKIRLLLGSGLLLLTMGLSSHALKTLGVFMAAIALVATAVTTVRWRRQKAQRLVRLRVEQHGRFWKGGEREPTRV